MKWQNGLQWGLQESKCKDQIKANLLPSRDSESSDHAQRQDQNGKVACDIERRACYPPWSERQTRSVDCAVPVPRDWNAKEYGREYDPQAVENYGNEDGVAAFADEYRSEDAKIKKEYRQLDKGNASVVAYDGKVNLLWRTGEKIVSIILLE